MLTRAGCAGFSVAGATESWQCMCVRCFGTYTSRGGMQNRPPVVASDSAATSSKCPKRAVQVSSWQRMRVRCSGTDHSWGGMHTVPQTDHGKLYSKSSSRQGKSHWLLLWRVEVQHCTKTIGLRALLALFSSTHLFSTGISRGRIWYSTSQKRQHGRRFKIQVHGFQEIHQLLPLLPFNTYSTTDGYRDFQGGASGFYESEAPARAEIQDHQPASTSTKHTIPTTDGYREHFQGGASGILQVRSASTDGEFGHPTFGDKPTGYE
jgi:hypothetical protein